MLVSKDFTTPVNASSELLSAFVDMVTGLCCFFIIIIITTKSRTTIKMVTIIWCMHITNSSWISYWNFSSTVFFPFVTFLYEIFFLSLPTSVHSTCLYLCFPQSLWIRCWFFNVTTHFSKSASVEEKENSSQQNFIYELEKTWSTLSVSALRFRCLPMFISRFIIWDRCYDTTLWAMNHFFITTVSLTENVWLYWYFKKYTFRSQSIIWHNLLLVRCWNLLSSWYSS